MLLLCHLGDKCIVCKWSGEVIKKVLLEGHPHNQAALLLQICGFLSQVGTHTWHIQSRLHSLKCGGSRFFCR